MGQMKNLLIDAEEALLAVEPLVAGLETSVDELRYCPVSKLFYVLVGVELEYSAPWYFVVEGKKATQIEASAYALGTQRTIELTEHVPDMLEAIA